MFAPEIITDLPKSTKTKNMKKNLLTLATILTVGFFTNNVSAQDTESKITNAGAHAHLVRAMSLVEKDQLDFGTILLNGTDAGVFTLNTEGDLSATSGTHLIATGGHSAKVGKYDVSGTKNSAYTVTLPTDFTVSTAATAGPGTVNIMTISDLQLKFVSNGYTLDNRIGVLSTAGVDKFDLGGKLNIVANQNEGIYIGTFTVSVDYN